MIMVIYMIKTVFMGTPEFAGPILDTLIKNTAVVLVVTQPDKYVGRKKVLTYSPIKSTLCLWTNCAKRSIRYSKTWMY